MFDTEETKDDRECYEFAFFGDTPNKTLHLMTQVIMTDHIKEDKTLHETFKFFKFSENGMEKDACDAMFKAFRYMWKKLKEEQTK